MANCITLANLYENQSLAKFFPMDQSFIGVAQGLYSMLIIVANVQRRSILKIYFIFINVFCLPLLLLLFVCLVIFFWYLLLELLWGLNGDILVVDG